MRVTRASAAGNAEAVSEAFKNSLEKFQHAEQSTSSVSNFVPKPSSLKRKESTTDVRSPTPTKKRRESSKYAPPSQYAHLKGLQDVLEDNLIAVFVGFNPGIQTATQGHAYAHPSNLFWKLLHCSGLTDRRWKPQEDRNLPSIGLGNTNLVARPTKDAGQLSKAEMADSVPVLEEKIRKYRPEAVCIVGKSIWESIWRHRYGRNPKPAEFKYGWQDKKEKLGRHRDMFNTKPDPWEGADVFVTTSTSGLSASLKPAEKEAIWQPFGEWVQRRRVERAAASEISSPRSRHLAC